MGLKVQGFGASRAELSKVLEPIERELALIAETPLGETAIPKSKKELRARADQLDQTIAVLERHLQNPDPKIKASAGELLEVAKKERLRLEDGLLTWMVDDLQSPRKANAADRDTSVAAPEMAAVSALIRGVVTDAELHHAMEVLAPIAGQNLTDAYFQPQLDHTTALFDSMKKKTSPAALKVAGLRVGPAIGGFLGTSVVRSLGGPPALAFFTAALAIRMGITSGKYLASEEIARVRFETGNNRIEGEVDHDLARIAERAAKGLPFAEKKGPELTEAAKQEAALVDYLTARRKETWPDRQVSAGEKQTVAAFEQYSAALKSSGDEVAIKAARTAVKKATAGVELKSLPSLPELLPHAYDTNALNAAFGDMVSEYGRILVGASNPPLARMVQHLEKKGAAPDAGELAYLKMLVGPDPSLGEVLALAPMFAKGAIDPKSLWAEDAAIQIPGGGTLDQASVKTLLSGLGSRDEGERMAWWGKVMHVAAPVLGSLIGAGVMALLPGGLIGVGGALVGTLLSEKASHVAGNYLAGKGDTTRVMSGVELAPAVDAEYALGIGQLMRADELTRGTPAEVASKLRDVAGTLDAMVASVGRMIAATEAHRAQVPDGPEKEAIDHALALFQELQAPIYGRLGEVAAHLAQAADRGDLAGMRQAVTEARAGLAEAMPAMVLDVLVSQSSPELSLAHGLYFRAKKVLAEAVIAGAKPDALAPLAKDLRDAYAAIPKKQRPDDDGLDKWANKAKDEPAKLGDRSDIEKLVGPSYLEKLETQRVETLSINDKRAAAIGQEVMNALWTQVYARFGLHDSGEVPELAGVRLERTPVPEAEGFSDVKLTAKLKGGGRFEMKIDALGVPSADLSTLHVDLGEKRLGQFVASAAAHEIAAATGKAPVVGKVELQKRSDESYVFTMMVDGQKRTATISPDGILPPNFLA